MPFNEVWLPLITMAFPHAKIVRVVRHPLDVCVSMMSNNLTHGFNCGYRIEDTCIISRRFSTWSSTIAASSGTTNICSATSRSSPTRSTRPARLLAYLGLPFDEACLRFHENRRHAPTPSYAQVIEPLNDRSIGRHRHYARQLAPFLPRLEPIMAAHDYHV